jgi:hypothetical protein
MRRWALLPLLVVLPVGDAVQQDVEILVWSRYGGASEPSSRRSGIRVIDLDTLLPDAPVRSHHRRSASASADEVWEAAGALRLSDTKRLGRLVRWRLPDTPPDCTFRELLRRYPFTLLDEGPRYSISGLCGRIWTFRTDYPRLSGPADFAAWDEPGTVRVLFATWTQERADGRVELCDEARVLPVDRAAALRLRLLWAAVGRFEGLIGSEAISAAVNATRSDTARLDLDGVGR